MKTWCSGPKSRDKLRESSKAQIPKRAIAPVCLVVRLGRLGSRPRFSNERTTRRGKSLNLTHPKAREVHWRPPVTKPPCAAPIDRLPHPVQFSKTACHVGTLSTADGVLGRTDPATKVGVRFALPPRPDRDFPVYRKVPSRSTVRASWSSPRLVCDERTPKALTKYTRWEKSVNLG